MEATPPINEERGVKFTQFAAERIVSMNILPLREVTVSRFFLLRVLILIAFCTILNVLSDDIT